MLQVARSGPSRLGGVKARTKVVNSRSKRVYLSSRRRERITAVTTARYAIKRARRER